LLFGGSLQTFDRDRPVRVHASLFGRSVNQGAILAGNFVRVEIAVAVSVKPLEHGIQPGLGGCVAGQASEGDDH
jgi:hypothetical protein